MKTSMPICIGFVLKQLLAEKKVIKKQQDKFFRSVLRLMLTMQNLFPKTEKMQMQQALPLNTNEMKNESKWFGNYEKLGTNMTR